MKILAISLSGAGDVLMATPLIKELRLNYPKARIDCLVMQGRIAADILKNNRDISRIIYFNFMREGIFKSLKFCGKLRKENYDLSITTYPQARYHYSIISCLAGAKKRIGFNYDNQLLKLNNLFFTDALKEDFSSHVVSNNLNVLKVLNLRQKIKSPKIVLNLSRSSVKFAEDFFRKNDIKKAVAVHAGSGTTKNFALKRWNKDKFAELCLKLSREGFKIILLGGKDENGLKNYIIAKSGLMGNREIFNLDTEIQNVAAIIRKCALVVSNDTIMGHIAAAVGARVISLFGPTSPENTAPYSKNAAIICKRPKEIKPFMHGSKITKEQASYMDKISVSEVLSKI